MSLTLTKLHQHPQSTIYCGTNISVQKAVNAGVLHSLDKKSDHSPIYCDINDTCNNATQLVKKIHNDSINLRSLKPPDWDNYITTVEQNLQDLQTPLSVCCKNIHCKDERHIAEMTNTRRIY